MILCYIGKGIRNFPGSAVVKSLPAHAGDTGLTPGWETKIPLAPGQQSPCTATPEPAPWSPCTTTAAHAHHNRKEGVCEPQGKPCVLQLGPDTAK